MRVFKPLLTAGRPLKNVTFQEAFKGQPRRMKTLTLATAEECNMRLRFCKIQTKP